jgi:CheY-like chemotaxis protein
MAMEVWYDLAATLADPAALMSELLTEERRALIIDPDEPSDEPAPWPGEMAAVTAVTPSRDALDGLTLVLVEDDRDCRDVLAFWFESFGATVIAVGSARAALAELEQSLPDVVVTDISMPDRDGFWLVERIRATLAPRGVNVPVIACTGLDAHAIAERTHLAGFDGYVTKPVDPATLSACVAEVVALSRVA